MSSTLSCFEWFQNVPEEVTDEVTAFLLPFCHDEHNMKQKLLHVVGFENGSVNLLKKLLRELTVDELIDNFDISRVQANSLWRACRGAVYLPCNTLTHIHVDMVMDPFCAVFLHEVVIHTIHRSR